MIIEPPPPHADNPVPKFLTYAYYIRSFGALAGFMSSRYDKGEVLGNIGDKIENLSCYQELGQYEYDLQKIRSALSNAWGTEFLLALAGNYINEDDLLKLANNWASVQLYYTLYHGTQALMLAKGYIRPQGHSPTQRVFADFWARESTELAPWTVAAVDGGLINVPPNIQISPDISTVARPKTITECWSLVAKALKTTRGRAYPEALKHKRQEKKRAKLENWRKEESQRLRQHGRPRKEPRYPLPHLTLAEKLQAQNELRPYTMMDFFWRLRLKTNYEDSRMFIEGPVHPSHSREVHDDLINLASASLFLNEMFILKIVGKTNMEKMVDGWLKANTPPVPIGISLRRDILLS